MKHLLVVVSFSLCFSYSSAQDWIVDPANSVVSFDASGQPFVKMKIQETGGTVHGMLSLFSENTTNLLNLTLGQGGDGGIEINDKTGFSTFIMDSEGLLLRDGVFNLIDADRSNGIRIFNKNNGNLMYQIKGQIFSGYNNGGTQTIRINTNLGGDGRITTDELEILGGSDLAEYFDVQAHNESSIDPGLLVSIASEDGTLKITDHKRDKKIVGVVSGANGVETGMFMGQKGSIAHGDYPIALTGRTYVMSTTENGAIQAGDLLTSSSTPGHAMRVKKYKRAQGAILGKALTSMRDKSGYVLVLVNLQ